jgi:hypothetical protein
MPYTIATTTPGVSLTTVDIGQQAGAFKTALALNAVNNTSDVDKPVSTAQQAALNLKMSKSFVRELLYSPPSLDHAFADDKAFTRTAATTNSFDITARKGPPLIYTMGSASTTVDADGLVKYSPENLLLRSEQFNNGTDGTTTPWNVLLGQAFGSGSVSNDTGTLAPDNTYTAEKFLEASSASGQTILRQAYAFEPSTAYTFSVYAKYGSRQFLSLYCVAGGGYQQTFNLITGVKGSFSSGILSSTMTAVGNGWYRCSITFLSSTTPTTNVVDIRYSGTDASSDTAYTRNGSFNLLWGAQLERATGVRAYLSTTTSVVYGPRFWHDPSDSTSRGLLLERESANRLWPSNTFTSPWYTAAATVTANVSEVADPAGTFTADSFKETGGAAAAHTVQHNILAANIATYTNTATSQRFVLNHTFSCFVKPNGRSFCKLTVFGSAANGTTTGTCVYNLSGAGSIGSQSSANYPATIKAFANGWYRISITSNTGQGVASSVPMVDDTVVIAIAADSGGGNYGGNAALGLYVYGAQLEAGGRASTYIPTVGTTVARAASDCRLEGAGFASIYNQNEGTVKLAVNPLDPINETHGMLGIEVNSRPNGSLGIITNGIATFQVALAKESYTPVATYTTTWNPSSTTSVALAYKSNDCNAAFNGVAQTAITNTTLGSEPMVRMVLGANGITSGPQPGSGIFSRLTIYKKRISNEYLTIATS